MDYEIKNLRSEDRDLLLSLERKHLRAQQMDELEAQMQEWKSRWREEALDHYLPQGWSFGIFDSATGELQAYFIAKVIPFFRSYTQVLWVERFFSSSPAMQQDLLELIYRYAREKHLQQVMFEGEQFADMEIVGKRSQALTAAFHILKTTRNED